MELAPATPVRLAELVGALSLATDLADGFPPEKAVRTALGAVCLARALALDESVVHDTYWSALLLFVGCTAYAPEESAMSAGQDIALRARLGALDGTRKRDEWRAIADLTRPAGRGRQLRTVLRTMLDPATSAGFAAAQCEVAVRLAARLGMSEAVQRALQHKEEHFDGSGGPAGLVGDAIAVPMRLVRVVHVLELFTRLAGADEAQAVLRARAGRQLDPTLVDAARRFAVPLHAVLTGRGAWTAFLEAEPAPLRVVDDVTTVAHAFAHFADLKSAWSMGHSTGVAALVTRVAPAIGLTDEATTSLEQAALLHDLGRVGVPNAIWDKAAPLDASEWEQVRLHSYFTERTLRRAPALAAIATTAARHHERLDGSGYHAGLPGHLLGLDERLLAVCDVWEALRAPRAHRPALAPAAAVRVLHDEARARRLDHRSVEAVLDLEAPTATRRRAPHPSGLTEREVDVLRRLAVGRTNKEIARELGIATRTIGHHVAHIYEKLGVSTRAGAALAAMERGVL